MLKISFRSREAILTSHQRGKYFGTQNIHAKSRSVNFYHFDKSSGKVALSGNFSNQIIDQCERSGDLRALSVKEILPRLSDSDFDIN